jgi:hypothetical protein
MVVSPLTTVAALSGVIPAAAASLPSVRVNVLPPDLGPPLLMELPLPLLLVLLLAKMVTGRTPGYATAM